MNPRGLLVWWVIDSQEIAAEAAASKSANFLLKERVEELTTALEQSAEALRAEMARHGKELEEKLHEAVVNTRAQVEAEVKAEMDKRQWIIEGKEERIRGLEEQLASVEIELSAKVEIAQRKMYAAKEDRGMQIVKRMDVRRLNGVFRAWTNFMLRASYCKRVRGTRTNHQLFHRSTFCFH